jgi:hypothetical protein
MHIVVINPHYRSTSGVYRYVPPLGRLNGPRDLGREFKIFGPSRNLVFGRRVRISYSPLRNTSTKDEASSSTCII